MQFSADKFLRMRTVACHFHENLRTQTNFFLTCESIIQKKIYYDFFSCDIKIQ